MTETYVSYVVKVIAMDRAIRKTSLQKYNYAIFCRVFHKIKVFIHQIHIASKTANVLNDFLSFISIPVRY